jgi:hypothetical protein
VSSWRQRSSAWPGTTGLQRCYWLALPAEVRRTVVGHRQTRKAVGARAIPGAAHVPNSCGSSDLAAIERLRPADGALSACVQRVTHREDPRILFGEADPVSDCVVPGAQGVHWPDASWRSCDRSVV